MKFFVGHGRDGAEERLNILLTAPDRDNILLPPFESILTLERKS